MADPEELERTPVAERVHRVHWFAGRIGKVLDDLTGTGAGAGVRVAALTAAETVETLGELTAAINRIQGLRLAVLAHADRLDVAADSGATSTASWLAHTTPIPHPQAHRLVPAPPRPRPPGPPAGRAGPPPRLHLRGHRHRPAGRAGRGRAGHRGRHRRRRP